MTPDSVCEVQGYTRRGSGGAPTTSFKGLTSDFERRPLEDVLIQCTWHVEG